MSVIFFLSHSFLNQFYNKMYQVVKTIVWKSTSPDKIKQMMTRVNKFDSVLATKVISKTRKAYIND